MSHNLSESDAYPGAIPTPDIGDDTYPFTVPEALGNLANRTNWLKNSLAGEPDLNVNYSERNDSFAIEKSPDAAIKFPEPGRNPLIYSFFIDLLGRIKYEASRISSVFSNVYGVGSTKTLSVPMVPIHITSGNTWVASISSNRPYWNQATAPADPALNNIIFPIPYLPATGYINVVNAIVKGTPSSHGSIASMTKPTISLLKASAFASSGATIIGTVTDPSANAAAYETDHQLGGTFNHQIINPDHYFIKITGEAGTNSQNGGFNVYGIYISVSNSTI